MMASAGGGGSFWILRYNFEDTGSNDQNTYTRGMIIIDDVLYSQTDSVTVDMADCPRKYWLYGINLVGFSHGREEGKRIQQIMQQEVPELWAQSQYREWHLWDLHHEVLEDGGIVLRRLTSTTPTDDWHENKAYKSMRRSQAFVWFPEGGKDLLEILV